MADTENAKDTLCRNVLIYGHCRYEDQGCAFNHDPNKMSSSHPDTYVFLISYYAKCDMWGFATGRYYHPRLSTVRTLFSQRPETLKV